MKTLVLLCLLCVLPQTKSEPTVALVFGDRVEIVTETQACAEYETLLKAKKFSDPRFVALTLALGTTQDIDRISLPRNNTREFLDNEIRRGVRKPLQGGEQ